MNPARQPMLFYDGECGLCAHSVRFILNHESAPVLQFAALQSDAAKHLLLPYGIDTEELNSLVLLDKKGAHTFSTAALRTCAYLKAPWRWGQIGLILPRALRDPIYRFIARHRLRFFKRSECTIPTPQERTRFLN